MLNYTPRTVNLLSCELNPSKSNENYAIYEKICRVRCIHKRMSEAKSSIPESEMGNTFRRCASHVIYLEVSIDLADVSIRQTGLTFCTDGFKLALA